VKVVRHVRSYHSGLVEDYAKLRRVHTDVSKERGAFIFKVKPPNASGLLLGLFDNEDKGTKISRNVGTYMSTCSNAPEDLNILSLDTFACSTAIRDRAARMLQVVPANHKTGRHITNINRSQWHLLSN
jgi:hypothetical protein